MTTDANLTGLEFDRLAVIELAPARTADNRQLWRCRCRCGNETLVPAANLVHGNSRSCGCLARELAAARKLKHGLSRTRGYYIWQQMVYRCTNPGHRLYSDYGALGVQVCDRWLGSVEAFLTDMGEPSTGAFLTRIDKLKGYEPGNCQWSMNKDRGSGRRQITKVAGERTVEWQGQTITIRELANKLGLRKNVLYSRLARNNWIVDDAVLCPNKQKQGRLITFAGLTLNIKEWSIRQGIGVETIRSRLKAGMSVEDALSKPGHRKPEPPTRSEGEP